MFLLDQIWRHAEWFLAYFVEFSQIGPNLLTLSFVVLSVLSLWQTHAYVKQARKIWRSKSALSVNITFAISICFILAAFAWYGIVHAKSIVIAINVFTLIPALFGVIGVWRYGSVKLMDKLTVILGVVGLLAFATPIDPKLVFFIFALAVTLPLVVQLRELYKTGVRGVLEGKLIATFMVKNIFYTTFAYTLPGGEPVLELVAPVWVLLSMWLMWKWYVSPLGEVRM